jgi:hypothetical protein
MEPTRSYEIFDDAIRHARSSFFRPITNFFVDIERLKQWISRSEVFTIPSYSNDVFIFLRSDHQFYHLYFIADNIDAINKELKYNYVLQDKKITVDIIGKDQDNNALTEMFITEGFCLRTKLNRMSKISEPKTLTGERSLGDIRFAEKEDVPQILDLLETNFDVLSEQIPCVEELIEAVDKENILLKAGDSEVAGLLFFECKIVSAVLRYWFIAEKYRNIGCGAKLMKSFLHICSNASRFSLWVKTDNGNAIDKYLHYGFKPENLFDCILVR